MAAGLVLAEAADPAYDQASDTAPETTSDPGAGPRQPRVIPVPGEVILRESTLPRPPLS